MANNAKQWTIFSFVEALNDAKICYETRSYRHDVIMFVVTVPGSRWEIEFSKEGDIEVEVFRSDGEIFDGSCLDQFIEDYSD